MTEAELRTELVKACRVLYAGGAAGDGLGGHVSVRFGEHILIKPRPVSWWKLAPEDLILLDFDGKRVEEPGKPSGVKEWPVHARVYAVRPDVHCVFHAHPAASTLMAALGIAVEPLDQDCAALTDRLPVLDNGGVSIATPALGDDVAKSLGSFGTLLIKNHGCVIAGESIAEVCVAAHKLERVAETMLRAAQLTTLPLLSAEKRATILAARKGVDSSSMNQERWRMLQDYYLDRAHD